MTYSSVHLCLASFALAVQGSEQSVHHHVQGINVVPRKSKTSNPGHSFEDKFPGREKQATMFKDYLGVLLENIRNHQADGKVYTSDGVELEFQHNDETKPNFFLLCRYCEGDNVGFSACDGLGSESLTLNTNLWDQRHKQYVAPYADIKAKTGFKYGYFYCAEKAVSNEGQLVAISVAETKTGETDDTPFSMAGTGTAKKYEGYGIATMMNVLRAEWLAKQMTERDLLTSEAITCTNAGWESRPLDDPQNTGSLTTYGFPLLVQGFTCVKYKGIVGNELITGYASLQEVLTYPEEHICGRGQLSFYHWTSNEKECKGTNKKTVFFHSKKDCFYWSS